MATQNKIIASMDGRQLIISFDYDDVSLNILAIHVTNTNTRTYKVSAKSTANGKIYSLTIPIGTNIDQSVPTNAANRLGLSVTPSGKLDGVEWSIS